MHAAEPSGSGAPAAAPTSAGQISAALAAALSVGDPTAATACFARDACLLTPDATTIRGRDHIRAILFQLIAMNPTVQVEQRGILIAGEVALATETWTIRLDGLDLTPFARTSETTTVLRRVEGNWKLQIAAPWGWAAADRRAATGRLG
jgi:ketosteroid isomerase-like protein